VALLLPGAARVPIRKGPSTKAESNTILVASNLDSESAL